MSPVEFFIVRVMKDHDNWPEKKRAEQTKTGEKQGNLAQGGVPDNPLEPHLKIETDTRVSISASIKQDCNQVRDLGEGPGEREPYLFRPKPSPEGPRRQDIRELKQRRRKQKRKRYLKI